MISYQERVGDAQYRWSKQLLAVPENTAGWLLLPLSTTFSSWLRGNKVEVRLRGAVSWGPSMGNNPLSRAPGNG